MLGAELNQGPNAASANLLTRLHLDLPLLLGLLSLCGFGLTVLFSATDESSRQVERQVLRLGLAFAVMVAVAQVPPRLLRRWALPLFGLAVLLLLAVLLVGDVGKGAQRWLDLGIVRFQPSEILDSRCRWRWPGFCRCASCRPVPCGCWSRR